MNKIKEFITNPYIKIVYSNNLLNITNYDSIIDINSNKIILSYQNKLIKIIGDNLKISKLLDKEILIIGNIKYIGEYE